MAGQEIQGSEVRLQDVLQSLIRAERKLDQLQINTGGEKWHEPRAASGKVTCKIRCTIISIGDIDTIKQEFWAKVYLSVQWRENNLRGKTWKDIDWNKHWDPQVYFVNAMKIDYQERWHTILDNSDGSTDVKLSVLMRATFKTFMKLKWFPFDYQKLTIKLMSDWPVEYVEFENDSRIRDRIRKDTFTDRHEWILHEHVIAEPVREMKEETGCINEYPLYQISVHVQRKHTHFLWNLVLVMFLIHVLSFASFTIPAGNADQRFGVTIALLLTAVAYKFVVNSKLPLIPYLTLLDKYVLWCLTLHSLMVIQNALALAFSSVVSNENIVDYVSVVILGCLTLAVNAAFAIIGITQVRKATAEMKMLKMKYDKIYEHMTNNGAQFADGKVIAMEVDVSFTNQTHGSHSP